MPIYEYRCTSCGHTFEVMQKLTDRKLRKCRVCSGKLEKLISRTAFALKGGGWYSQGYSRGKPASPSSSEEKDKKKGTGSGEAGSGGSGCSSGSCGCAS
jgi:putative FmdB family regulatory protein